MTWLSGVKKLELANQHVTGEASSVCSWHTLLYHYNALYRCSSVLCGFPVLSTNTDYRHLPLRKGIFPSPRYRKYMLGGFWLKSLSSVQGQILTMTQATWCTSPYQRQASDFGLVCPRLQEQELGTGFFFPDCFITISIQTKNTKDCFLRKKLTQYLPEISVFNCTEVVCGSLVILKFPN